MDLVEESLRRDICAVSHRMYHQGFSPACGGNISARYGDNCFLITPSGVSKKDLQPEMIVKINDTCTVLEGEGKASSEAKVHLFCYRHRPDAMAVCHAHPPYAVSFSCLPEKLDKYFLPEQIYYTGAIPTCSYALPGTEAVAESMSPFIARHSALLLGNHGPVTIGTSVFDAFHKMETVEHYAKVLFITKLMGGARTFSPEELQEIFDDIGGLDGVHPGYVTL